MPEERAMNTAEVLTDAFGRLRDLVHGAVDGLTAEQLAYQIDPEANTIGWLVWHLTRVQDDHVADAFGTDQLWLAHGWVDRFGLPFDPHAHGYGHSAQDVRAVRVESPELLTGYYDEVHGATLEHLAKLTDDDFDRVVDTRWDPPVTLGARLVSILEDDAQHAGQAAYVRGVVERR
jgi:Protein of unknown function (DUF664)